MSIPLRFIPWLLVLSSALIGASVVSAATGAATKARDAATPLFGQRDDVRAFAAEVAAETGLDVRMVERWFAAARHQPKIVTAMDRPLLAPPKWFEYAPPFVSAERVDGGLKFWRANAEALARAEQQFGVPPEVIVAIIGVETFYGRVTGSYRVIDALATLAFDYPRRAPFFRGELKEFVVLAHEQGLSPLTPKGSFAGAMGMPQFMPGSYRRFAIDFDGDGRSDLWASTTDVIGSVANYLARHDWMPGQPVLLPAVVAPDLRDGVLRKVDGGISERRPLAAWAADGVAPARLPADFAAEPVGLLLLEENGIGEAATSLWIACPNFYVITRYNRSRLYASAVWALAQRLRAAQ
jgi:membrane-bound lytic murein transglycosylase B